MNAYVMVFHISIKLILNNKQLNTNALYNYK